MPPSDAQLRRWLPLLFLWAASLPAAAQSLIANPDFDVDVAK